ncbi:hypothetical protein [uncultured Draconibacterium sp.]|uniref:hypothetical protein n=1 Tax=uncultured Draconibacterium sp. TaxID=1573823 RepID=UPI00321691B3
MNTILEQLLKTGQSVLKAGQLTEAIILCIEEKQFYKKDGETDRGWMERLDRYFTEFFIGIPLEKLFYNISLFDDYAVILIKALIDISKRISDYDSLSLFNSIKNEYGRQRIHTNVTQVRAIESIFNKDRQKEARICLIKTFSKCWFYAHIFSLNGKFTEYDDHEFSKWYQNILEPPKSPLRLYVDTDENILKSYSHYDDADSYNSSCKRPFPGKGGACTRNKGHKGSHIIRLPNFGIVAAWEDYYQHPSVVDNKILHSEIDRFFPIKGIMLGNTTLAEMTLMFGFENGIISNFKHVQNLLWIDNNDDGIAETLRIQTSSMAMPSEWEKFGFQNHLSYQDWYNLFEKYNFSIDVTTYPEIEEDDEGHKSLCADFTAISKDKTIQFSLYFRDGNENGEGYDINSYNSLWRMDVSPSKH